MAISHPKTTPFQRTLSIIFFIAPGNHFSRKKKKQVAEAAHDAIRYWNVWHFFGYKARERNAAPRLLNVHERVADRYSCIKVHAWSSHYLEATAWHSLAIKTRERPWQGRKGRGQKRGEQGRRTEKNQGGDWNKNKPEEREANKQKHGQKNTQTEEYQEGGEDRDEREGTMQQEEQKTETERTGDQKPEKKQIENRKKERRIVQPSSSALPPCTR